MREHPLGRPLAVDEGAVARAVILDREPRACADDARVVSETSVPLTDRSLAVRRPISKTSLPTGTTRRPCWSVIWSRGLTTALWAWLLRLRFQRPFPFGRPWLGILIHQVPHRVDQIVSLPMLPIRQPRNRLPGSRSRRVGARLVRRSNSLRVQRSPLYAVPVFRLTVPLHLLQRYRRRRPDFVGNQPWPTMLMPGFPKFSHPGLRQVLSSIRPHRSSVAACKTTISSTFPCTSWRPINSDRGKPPYAQVSLQKVSASGSRGFWDGEERRATMSRVF